MAELLQFKCQLKMKLLLNYGWTTAALIQEKHVAKL